MTDNRELPGHRHSIILIWIVLAALLVGVFALALLTYAPGSPVTMILVAASGIVLIGFVVVIIAKELRAHRRKRSD